MTWKFKEKKGWFELKWILLETEVHGQSFQFCIYILQGTHSRHCTRTLCLFTFFLLLLLFETGAKMDIILYFVFDFDQV